MKILIVNKFLFPNGGSETYIFELGKQLISMGHEAQYFGMDHPDRIVGNNIDAYTANMDFHGAGKLSKLIAPFKIIYSTEARKQIRRILDDFKPDVVHLNNINFQITPSIIYEIRKWGKCKIVFTAHDYQWICPNHMMYIPQKGCVCDKCINGKYVECTRNACIHESKMRSLIGSVESYYYSVRKTYGLVDTIICPSQFLYDTFANNKVIKDKLVMMHNFVTVDSKDTNAQATDDKAYVLYFGRFDLQKGIRTLIEAAKRLPDIRFVFAGRGPLEEEISQIPNIDNVGFKSGNELRSLIENALFSVYPSEWYENCPFSVMESQMYGTPVIGANIGGIPELINTSQDKNPTGMVFEAGNVESLTYSINKLWHDRELLSEYSVNCGSLPFMNAEQYTERLLEIYQ